MDTSNKIYRIFISSCIRLLEEERQILSRTILQHGHHPFQMEFNFDGSTLERPLSVDMEKIQQADSVICILNYLYGEVIGEKMGDIHSCPLFQGDGDCKSVNCACRTEPYSACSLSFTEFEYEYSKLLGKPVFVIYNKKYNDLVAFREAISSLDSQTANDYEHAFMWFQRDNNRFVGQVTRHFAYPYSSIEEFKGACRSAVLAAQHSMLEVEKHGSSELGLVPFSCLFEANKNVQRLQSELDRLITNGIEAVYDTQSSAIIALEDEARKGTNIYLDQSGRVSEIKILAIRGISFTQKGMGHEEWSKFIMNDTYKRKHEVPVEFLLADCSNEKLIEDRYSAFSKEAETLADFKTSYQEEMETVQTRIKQYKGKHPCSLYLHHESKLPFRMIFIGKYLFLSTFISNLPAALAPVMKIPYSSTLYKVCEEYYNWIKTKSDTVAKL